MITQHHNLNILGSSLYMENNYYMRLYLKQTSTNMSLCSEHPWLYFSTKFKFLVEFHKTLHNSSNIVHGSVQLG
jgi:hypothetical protein